MNSPFHVFFIFTVVVFSLFECGDANNLLEAYFKHRAAHNSINNRILATNGRNHLDPDYSVEEAREPGSFVKLHETGKNGWLGLSQPVSPHRDELRASSMIQHLHSYSKRLSGHIVV